MALTTYKVRDPQGNLREIRGPEGATDEQIISKAKELFSAAPAAKDYRAMQKIERIDPTEGMGGMAKFNAGVGKALTDIGQGAAQMVGMGPNAEEVRNRRELDRPLMRTGAGMAGNIGTNIAALAPLAVAPGGATIAGAGTLGAISGALQPTEGAG